MYEMIIKLHFYIRANKNKLVFNIVNLNSDKPESVFTETYVSIKTGNF